MSWAVTYVPDNVLTPLITGATSDNAIRHATTLRLTRRVKREKTSSSEDARAVAEPGAFQFLSVAT
jgi:hypothetical protein